MRALFIVLTLTLALALGAESAGGSRDVEWPAATGGWAFDGKQETYDPETVFRYIDGAAEVYLAYNLKGVVVRRYVRAGRPLITVDVYRLGSSEDAFGVFSFEQQDESAGIGQGSEYGGGLLRFWKGPYFVSVYADGEGADTERAVLELGRAVAAAIPTTGAPPPVVDCLPGKSAGLVEGSVRFVRSHVLLNQRVFISHENILALDGSTGAALATYSRAGKAMRLLLVNYPSEERAAAALSRFRASFPGREEKPGTVRAEDGTWVVSEGRAEVVMVVFGAPSIPDAETLLAEARRRLPGRRK